MGKVFGATLLVAGCCIGAGMLGLPVLTAPGGFYPTSFFFFVCWLFMATTGLLLLEVNLWFEGEVSIITMAAKTLGVGGKMVAWLLFAFLFYSLMVAYTSGSGQLLTDFIRQIANVDLPVWVGSLFFSTGMGFFLYMGTRTVDHVNRLLMAGLAASYFVLVGMGSSYVNKNYLNHSDWTAAVFAVPAMIISFGFHNLIPSLATYLNRDTKNLRFSILVGSAIPLIIYLAWQWLILGMVPLEGEGGFRQALEHGDMATRVLRQAIKAPWVIDFAEYFAFFAIVTSFLSVALSFVDFLADGLGVKKNRMGKGLLCALSLLPPFIFSVIYPHVFLAALSSAGAFGAVVLFGIFPALMVWSGRYLKKIDAVRLVPGGRSTLLLVILFSLAVFSLEFIHQYYH